jgi:hypothetical protein
MKYLANLLTTDTITKWLSSIGLALCIIAAGLLICNQYGALSALTPYYRINTSALCLLFGFVTACCGIRFAIAGCVFALPLLPTFAQQFQIYTGYGRILDVSSAGLDLIAGVLLGLIVNSLWQRKTLHGRITLPWPAGLVVLILTVSVAVAITRNLYQSASPFVPHAFIYNLMHLRTLGWHDDYRPLLDWIAYAMAFLLLALFVPALKSMPNRNNLIFIPLIAGLVIAAWVGLRQSTLGVGLSVSQITFRQGQFGYMALGFQPDLHAFGGQMLLGVVGLFGYLYAKKNVYLRLLVICTVVPFCGLVLFLSKSKASFALAIVCLMVLAALWLLHRFKYFWPVVVSLGLASLMIMFSMVIFTDSWVTILSLTLHKFNLPDLHTLNLQLSYRPEVYLAAFRIFTLFPFAGLGQSEFYRQSASHDLTQSLFLSFEQNGENAHNYFLQTLAETGVLGVSAFVLLLAYPIIRATEKRALIPGIIALLAVFSGNLFAHSMLVRENLLLAMCFIALMYATVQMRAVSSKQGNPLPSVNNPWLSNSLRRLSTQLTQPKILIGLTLISLLWVAKETYQSLSSSPFNIDIQCHEKPRLSRDGWTSGRYVFDMPVGAQGMALQIIGTQPDVVQRPLPASLSVWYDRRLLLQKDFVLNKTEPQQLVIDLPDGVFATPDDYQIELKVQRCFVPRNFGMSEDSRRLGVRVESVNWK